MTFFHEKRHWLCSYEQLSDLDTPLTFFERFQCPIRTPGTFLERLAMCWQCAVMAASHSPSLETLLSHSFFIGSGCPPSSRPPPSALSSALLWHSQWESKDQGWWFGQLLGCADPSAGGDALSVVSFCCDAPAWHLMVPEFVFTSLLRVAHTEAGKNWGALFRADFLKENVEKSGGFTLNCNYILDLNSESTSYWIPNSKRFG